MDERTPQPAGAAGAVPAQRSPVRVRRTVALSRDIVLDLLRQAVQAEVARARQGLRRWTEPYGATVSPEGVHDQMLALLKAFADAALPKGGLPVDGAGRPVQLDRLVAAGHACARAGDVAPKLLSKVRAGKPIDVRLADAVLAYFRLVLDRPTLVLEQLGAVEPERLRTAQRIGRVIQAVRDDLPASIHEGVGLRADEAAGYATVLDHPVIEYRDLHPHVDARGAHRIRLLRVDRYRPVRVARFAGLLRPTRVYEWYQWSHVESARLTIRLLDEQGACLRELQPPVRKHLDTDRGFVVFDIEPAALAELRASLVIEPPGPGTLQHEVQWEEQMVFNAADRDLVVGISQPMNRPRIVFDELRYPGVEMRVGDSPGLRRVADGWQLDRTLLPREVLAVRLRLKVLQPCDAATLSPSGEWCGPAAG